MFCATKASTYNHTLNADHCHSLRFQQSLVSKATLYCNCRLSSQIYYYFYTPVWKTDILCCSNVCLSAFSGLFFNMLWDINLKLGIYTCGRWHDMSSLSCIAIGSFWPSLQPKVGQSHFGNHGLINQDKFFEFGTQGACCILLDISSVFCSDSDSFIVSIITTDGIMTVLSKYYFRNFGESKFSGLFFYMFWYTSFKLGIYMQWVVLHVKFEFHSNQNILTYLTVKNRSKSFICIHGLKNHIEASDLVRTLI